MPLSATVSASTDMAPPDPSKKLNMAIPAPLLNCDIRGIDGDVGGFSRPESQGLHRGKSRQIQCATGRYGHIRHVRGRRNLLGRAGKGEYPRRILGNRLGPGSGDRHVPAHRDVDLTSVRRVGQAEEARTPRAE